MPCGDARQRLDLKNGDVVDLGDVAEGEVPVREGDELAGVPLGRALKAEVHQATAAALPTNTLSGGVLTASASGALGNIDGVSAVVGRRYLVKDEVAQAKNGIYVVTSLGSVSAPWVLTRATDADDDADLAQGCIVFVRQGTTNAKKLFRMTNSSPPVVDSTSIAFEEYPSASGAVVGVEIGATMEWFGPASTIPAGWLALDGSAISRTTYAALYALMGTTWGVGDGSTTFNLPDTRTYYVRGANADGDLGAATGSGSTGAAATGITAGIVNTVPRQVAAIPNNTAAAQAPTINDPTHVHSVNPPHVCAWKIIRAL